MHNSTFKISIAKIRTASKEKDKEETCDQKITIKDEVIQCKISEGSWLRKCENINEEGYSVLNLENIHWFSGGFNSVIGRVRPTPTKLEMKQNKLAPKTILGCEQAFTNHLRQIFNLCMSKTTTYRKCSVLLLNNAKGGHQANFTLGDNQIIQQNCVKDLGVFVDQHLKFEEHINHVVTRANLSLIHI